MGHSGQFWNLNNMAASLWRTSTSLLRRSLSITSVRCAGGPPSKPIDQHKGKYADDDPFEMKPIKRAKGTFDEPTIVSSAFEKRMIGCVCEEDALTIQWLTIHKGEPKRCECGYWFKLVDAQTKPY